MTVVKVEEVAKVDENPALVGENPGLDDEAEAGYVSPDDEDGDDEDDETDSDGDYEIPSGDGVPELKKGPWTPDEDKRLKSYVEVHGEGNWNEVQRNGGLNRCGKSCRLRWANHLRPDLKKGPFDAEEVDKIIRFHIMWGNKWAKMASHLPGRTDNEIKNYWNTRLKRNQRHGLPIYPEYMLSQVTHPHQDMNCETPGVSHGKKQLNEYAKEKVVDMHDLIDEVMTFQHLDYEKDPVIPTKPLKRYASTVSLQIPDETEKTFCSTDLNYVLTKSQSVPLGGYPVELPSFQSSSFTLSNDWLLQCPSASMEQQIIQSPESISSQTTGMLGANVHNSDILDDPTKSGRSFEIPIPMVFPMMHSSSVFGNSEHEGCPITKIQASNLSSGSDAVFNLSQCYPVASFSDPGIPDTPPEASFYTTPPEASFLNDTTPLDSSFLNDNLKDQSHLYWQEPKLLTDGGQWFDPCHKLDFPGP
ncbi:transcription factor MYB7-like [Miscanthus floridulus]|uniref:transcription factor MYB7-like n=1 Tax=Miscanthus floridulus TaxID=154761 RepID=UPI00345751F9